MAKQRLYRCLNPRCPAKLQKPPVRNFESETPVCPHCGTGKDDPRGVVAIETIHYLVNVPLTGAPIKTGLGGRMVACLPQSRKRPKFVTGEPKAVNCPRCLASEVLKQHVANKVDQHLPFVEQVITGQPTAVKNVTKRTARR